MRATLIRTMVLGCGLLGAGAALAHPGHGGHGFAAGLMHPLGLDHLLAVLAVGLWSVLALPAGKAWQGPALFMAALLATALLGLMGFMLPFMELALTASVLLFGVLLLLAATGRRLPTAAGLGLVALAAAWHGLAHGFAAPGAGLGVYALGLLLATALLHGAGMALGLALQRRLSARHRRVAVSGLGAALLAGGTALLLGQLAA